MEKKITQCEIKKGTFMNVISFVYEDGQVENKHYSYFPDELYFSEDEFIGLTRTQAVELITKRDTAYLRR